jgi:pimeloyl-ACP methyl ester carboxylesterase
METVVPGRDYAGPVRSGYPPVNEIQLYYAIYGKGKPLILLHGGLGNMENFGNQIPGFANTFEVIAVDNRGHGRSTRSS